MQLLQADKAIGITPPGAIVDNAAFTTAAVDTLGMGECLLVAYFGAMDIAATVFKLQESDASNMSGATDVTGADFSVAPLTLPSATSDNTIFLIHVRCGGQRKRYLDLSVTGGDGSTGTYLTVTALLTKSKNVPYTATDRGAAQIANV